LKWAKTRGLGVRKEIEGEPASGLCRNSEQDANGDRCVRQTHREETMWEGVADQKDERSVAVVIGGRQFRL